MSEQKPALTGDQTQTEIPSPDKITVKDIVALAGGASKLAEASGDAFKNWAAYKWEKSGIPAKHWSLIIRLTGLSADHLLKANEKALGQS